MSSIKPFTVPVLTPELGATPIAPPPQSAQATSFASELGKAVQQVDGLQMTADTRASEVASGGGNLHETALALEKADIGMRVATRVRNKLIEAYQEVMRMSV